MTDIFSELLLPTLILLLASAKAKAVPELLARGIAGCMVIVCLLSFVLPIHLDVPATIAPLFRLAFIIISVGGIIVLLRRGSVDSRA